MLIPLQFRNFTPDVYQKTLKVCIQTKLCMHMITVALLIMDINNPNVPTVNT